MLSPHDLGAPEKFSHWRPEQEQAVRDVLNSQHRFNALVAPTGCGKSLIYMLIALLSRGRTCILTSTKALMSQLMADFASAGLVDQKGQNNYPCLELEPGGTYHRPKTKAGYYRSCEFGPCHWGYDCPVKGSCHYYVALNTARGSELVVTNYSYWLHSTHYRGSEGLGKFDTLILDEAHAAPDHLGDFLQIKLNHEMLRRAKAALPPSPEDPWEVWVGWARTALVRVQDKIEEISGLPDDNPNRRRTIKGFRDLVRELRDVITARGVWIPDTQEGLSTADPLWPSEYPETLFQEVGKVVLTSATLNRETLRHLGVGDPYYKEYPSHFPDHRRPLIWVPTVRLNYRSDKTHLAQWVRRIDQIIRGRLDRKGVIHTVSYSRRDFLLEHSEYARHMITHSRRDTAKRVELFKRTDPPAILVSPAVATGVDFPYTACEYQIVGKVPFPDTRAAVLKARCKEDDSYQSYIAMKELVQMSGRGMRAADDGCEILCVDDMIQWFLPKYRHFAPEWFMRTYRRANTIPKPPPKLVDKR